MGHRSRRQASLEHARESSLTEIEMEGMCMSEQGVTITLREIYDSMQKVAKGLERIESRITQLEDWTSVVTKTDERSRKAYQKASEALEKAQSVKAEMDKVREAQLETKKWIFRKIIGALITGAIAGVLGSIASALLVK